MNKIQDALNAALKSYEYYNTGNSDEEQRYAFEDGHKWTLEYLAGLGDEWKNTDALLDGSAIECAHSWFSKFNDIELANNPHILIIDSFKWGARWQYERDKLQIAALKEIQQYIPKIPTQPYEKELAQKCQELESEIAALKLSKA